MHSYFQNFPFSLLALFSQLTPPAESPFVEPVTEEPDPGTSNGVSLGLLVDPEIFKAKQAMVLMAELDTISAEMNKAMEPFQRRLMVASMQRQTASIELAAMLHERLGIPMAMPAFISPDQEVVLIRAGAEAAGLKGKPYDLC